jgi:tRNA pseudouridine55 synthase
MMEKTRKELPSNGSPFPGKIIAIYKPAGMTSHDVIDEIRRRTGIKKVGHAGTLDPFAQGVLVVGIGREATRQLGTLSKLDKEYIAKLKFGWNSTTDDVEGKKEEIQVSRIPSREEIESVVSSFQGEITQVPPRYSAIKIAGQTAYKRARKGEEIEMPERTVVIHEIEILEYEWPYLKIRTLTSSGTYIRALARDIGAKLGTGAYLEELMRTRVGTYTIEACLQLSEIQ